MWLEGNGVIFYMLWRRRSWVFKRIPPMLPYLKKKVYARNNSTTSIQSQCRWLLPWCWTYELTQLHPHLRQCRPLRTQTPPWRDSKWNQRHPSFSEASFPLFVKKLQPSSSLQNRQQSKSTYLSASSKQLTNFSDSSYSKNNQRKCSIARSDSWWSERKGCWWCLEWSLEILLKIKEKKCSKWPPRL